MTLDRVADWVNFRVDRAIYWLGDDGWLPLVPFRLDLQRLNRLMEEATRTFEMLAEGADEAAAAFRGMTEVFEGLGARFDAEQNET